MSKLEYGNCPKHNISFNGDECYKCTQEKHSATADPIQAAAYGAGDGLRYDRAVLLDLVIQMRDLQKKFFAGDRSVVAKAKKAEAQVDAAVNLALHQVGVTPATWAKRPPPISQGGLF